ncbi:MAG: pyruvate formate lyase family protein [Clostridia bacterium]|nr:pyruvate formate lyase family protein [Clostridia bacterium]
MELSVYRKSMEQELDSYYSTFDPCTEPLLQKLQQLAEECTDVSSYERKTRTYELLTEECPVHLFKENDFFFEISSGRPRHSWGGLQSPVGCFWNNRTADQWIHPYLHEVQEDMDEAFLHTYNPVSIDHHCPGYDTLLRLGLNGIIQKTEEKLAACNDLKKQEFYRCVIRANKALLRLAERFKEEACRLAAAASSPEEKAHFEKIAAAAENVPANPPATFYEGMCTVLFYRECVGSIDGIGFSTFGQLDRMLLPLYEADLATGRTTPEEAQALIAQLLLYTEVRFEAATGYYETSTTIELGGCDRDGNIIYNPLTELILDTVLALRTVNTKINCRISKAHPKAYLEKISRLQMAELPTVMMHNDDVLIPARTRFGQSVEDARMYVGGGCHEIVLQGTEVCTRADTWISLPRILLQTMATAAECCTYEDFYRQFTADVKAYHEKITAIKNKSEKRWCEMSPLVLYSSTIDGCLEQGMDVTEGGAKYSTVTLSMLGTATMIDSLYAIRQIVFEDKKLTLADFLRIVKNNFAVTVKSNICKNITKKRIQDLRFCFLVLHYHCRIVYY